MGKGHHDKTVLRARHGFYSRPRGLDHPRRLRVRPGHLRVVEVHVVILGTTGQVQRWYIVCWEEVAHPFPGVSTPGEGLVAGGEGTGKSPDQLMWGLARPGFESNTVRGTREGWHRVT